MSLDKEYSPEVFKTLLALPHFSKVEKLKAEAAVRMCSVKKVLEISQNSQENTCAGVSFLQPSIKIESLTQVFSCEFCEHLSKNIVLEIVRD